MAEEVPDVQLTRILLDGPGRESMPEPMAVDPGNACSAGQAAEHLLEAVGLEGDASTERAIPTGGDEE